MVIDKTVFGPPCEDYEDSMYFPGVKGSDGTHPYVSDYLGLGLLVEADHEEDFRRVVGLTALDGDLPSQFGMID